MAASTVAVPLCPLDDEGLPPFPSETERRQSSVRGEDERLKHRDEFWLSGVCIYVREYDQLLYGDPT